MQTTLSNSSSDVPHGAQWFWQSNSKPRFVKDESKYKWTPYGAQSCSKLENAYKFGGTIVDLDKDYDVDIRKMMQISKKDSRRRRRVKREDLKQNRIQLDPPEPLAKMDSNAFTCEICYVAYNKEEVYPAVLPCGHTFCISCCKAFRKVCPKCRDSFEDHQVKKNYTLIELLDMLVPSLTKPKEENSAQPPEIKSIATSSKLKKVDITDVPGLTLIENFITEAEETYLWIETNKLPWEKFGDWKRMKLGYTRNWHNSIPDMINNLPVPYKFVIDRIMDNYTTSRRPQQCVVNHYEPGQGTYAHIDKVEDYGEDVTSVNLGSDVVMQFDGPEGQKVEVFIPRRSLYHLEGAALDEWENSIPAKKKDNLENGTVNVRKTIISLTFSLFE